MGAAGLGALPILGISKVRDMLPEGNRTEKNTLDKMEDWAKKNFQNITDARQRELNKLMELMEKNPEEGLKYALPLSGHEERRGNAPAGWQLGQRQLTLGSNRGGGAADGWDMDYQTQITLQNQYRKSAREAEEKKKYDRAAYIYGEAIEIYLQTQQYEKAGDLFKKLGSEEKAQEMWEKELDNMTDPILQANLLKSKINSFERACQVLDEAWRQRKKPDKCLGMLFFDYYEREMELESLALINDVFTESVLPTQEKAKLGYKLITKNYFQSVTEKSREEILTLTSSSLVSNEESNNSKYLLKLLPDLAKSDQLLDRDAKRFSVSKSPIKQTLTSDFSGEFSSTYTRSIDTVGSWSSLANLGRQVSIAGSSQDLLTVAMLENKRCLSSQLRLTDYTGENDNIFHLGLLSSTGAKARIFYMQDSKKMHFRSLNKKRTSKHESIGSFQQVLAIGNSGSSNFFFLNYNQSGALLLNEYDINADLLDSVAIDIAPPEVLGAYWSCAGKDGHVCVAVGQAALWRFPDGQYAGIQLHEPIHKISFSPTTYQTAALISGEHEIALLQ